MTKKEAYKKCKRVLVSISQALEDNYNRFIDTEEMIEKIKEAMNKAPVEHWEELDEE